MFNNYFVGCLGRMEWWNGIDFFPCPFCLLVCLLTIILASSQAPLPNKYKKEESLEDFDHMLDMVG